MDASPRFLSAVAAVLFFTASAYLGAALFAPGEKPEAAEPAPQEVREYAEISGIAVRREQLVCSPGTVPGLRSGERIPCGAQVAEGLYTDSSAVFFGCSDGYEFLSPDMLSGLSAQRLDAILALPPGSTGAGRLVTGREWYIAAFSDRALPDSGSCPLYIGELSGYLNADIAEVSEENGRYTVLLRLTEGSPEALSLRKVSGKLITGLP